MKKILTIWIMIVLSFLVTSCGEKSDVVEWGKKELKVEVKKGEDAPTIGVPTKIAKGWVATREWDSWSTGGPAPIQ